MLIPIIVFGPSLALLVGVRNGWSAPAAFLVGLVFNLIGVLFLAVVRGGTTPFDRRQWEVQHAPQFPQAEPIRTSDVVGFVGIVAAIVLFVNWML